eukprot:4770059-Karenia_brevis.AAC.1
MPASSGRLSPRQTSAPSAAKPSGAAPPALHQALVLPKLASTPQCSRISCVILSNTVRALSL